MTTSQSTMRPSPPSDSPARETISGNDADIDIGGEAPIETELGPARCLAPRQGGKIEVGKANRLLQLVDPVADEKHPRHVGLLANELVNGMRIGLRPAEELHLVGKGRLFRCDHRGLTSGKLPLVSFRDQTTASTATRGMASSAKMRRVASIEPPTSMPRQASSTTTTANPQRCASSAE